MLVDLAVRSLGAVGVFCWENTALLVLGPFPCLSPVGQPIPEALVRTWQQPERVRDRLLPNEGDGSPPPLNFLPHCVSKPNLPPPSALCSRRGPVISLLQSNIAASARLWCFSRSSSDEVLGEAYRHTAC